MSTLRSRMVELHAVTKDYGRFRAVSGVTLSVAPGEVTGLLGPNGAGKSTLIRMICGLIAPTAGSIRVCGHDTVLASGLARGSIGYLPEFAPLYLEMTPREYLRFRAGVCGMRGAARATAVESAIGRCWLSEVADKRIGALSKGYRQRVGLAGALLHDPQVLILDEPTTGLDPTQIRQTRALLRELSVGRVVLLSSHILPEVEATCDRIVIIARGAVRAAGTPAELLRGGGTAAGAGGGVSESGGTYHVLVGRLTSDSQREQLAAAIALLPSVAAVRADESIGPGGLRVETQGRSDSCEGVGTDQAGPADLRESIAVLAAKTGVLLTELHHVKPSLEQVFMRVIAQEAA